MKNLTTTSGVIGAIVITVGAIFKSLHYPGSAVLVTLGAACLIIYALLYMLEKVKTAGDGTGKVYTVLFGITGMIMSLAFLFKVLHWPGAGWLIYAFFVAYVVLLVTAVIRIFQAGDADAKQAYTHNFIFLLGAGIILTFPTFFMLLNP